MGFLTFKGGIHSDDMKAMSKDIPIIELKPMGDMVYPLASGVGTPSKPLVKKGDRVVIGQKIGEADGVISSMIHASVSGTVKGIEKVLTPTGDKLDAIIIENDGLYEKKRFTKVKNLGTLSGEKLVEKIKEAGIVGMGGAGFPSFVKLGIKEPENITHIIVNGCECEPYLTADYRRMLENAAELLGGLKQVLRIFPNARGIIAVEDNKPDVIEQLEELVEQEERIQVKSVKTKYPQGSERQLIYAITGKAIHSKMLPADVGCILQNVETVIAIYYALCKGRPLIERVLTITGAGAENPCNVLVPIGADLQEVLELAGGMKEETKKVLLGGPMMGTSIFDLHIPIMKTTSGIVCLTGDAVSEAEPGPCIRCGKCVEVCPENLIPSYLARHADKNRPEEFEKLHGMECMECGCCSYICPAKRYLTQSIKTMKQTIMENKRKEIQKKDAKQEG